MVKRAGLLERWYSCNPPKLLFCLFSFSPSVTALSHRNCRRLPDYSSIRVGFWQNGFFADFYFWAAGFFRGFSRRIFSPHFCGKKRPEKSSRKIPGKILQNLYNKNPRHISAKGPAQHLICVRLSWVHT